MSSALSKLLRTSKVRKKNEKIAIDALLKVLTIWDVAPHNINVLIPISPCLFMHETHTMQELMNNGSNFVHATGCLQVDTLHASNHSYTRPASSCTISHSHPIRLVSSLHKFDASFGVIFVYCLLNQLHLSGICESLQSLSYFFLILNFWFLFFIHDEINSRKATLFSFIPFSFFFFLLLMETNSWESKCFCHCLILYLL